MDEKDDGEMVQGKGMIISVIIPTLNEGDFIKKTLEHLLSIEGNFEIIVIDGGSRDNTVAIVEQFHEVHLAFSEKGRSLQMNKGAEAATGDVLLFLHADTLLPRDAYYSIKKLFDRDRAVAGSFFLIFDDGHWFSRIYSRFSRLNLAFFTYGDHGIFIKKEVFQSIGGYKEIPFMEDVEIQNRLKSAGKFKKLDSGVITSSRRFLKNGTLKQFFTDLLLILLFKAGVSPYWLKNFYRDHC